MTAKLYEKLSTKIVLFISQHGCIQYTWDNLALREKVMIDNLEKDYSDSTTLCSDPMKDDSTSIISIFELFKETVFIDAGGGSQTLGGCWCRGSVFGHFFVHFRNACPLYRKFH